MNSHKSFRNWLAWIITSLARWIDNIHEWEIFRDKLDQIDYDPQYNTDVCHQMQLYKTIQEVQNIWKHNCCMFLIWRCSYKQSVDCGTFLEELTERIDANKSNLEF